MGLRVWLDILTLPGTPYADQFYADIEPWIFANYSSYAAVRPEWSKGWGYTASGAWTSDPVIDTNVPVTFRAGQLLNDNWDSARQMLDILDPARVFTSDFVTKLLTDAMSWGGHLGLHRHDQSGRQHGHVPRRVHRRPGRRCDELFGFYENGSTELRIATAGRRSR